MAARGGDAWGGDAWGGDMGGGKGGWGGDGGGAPKKRRMTTKTTICRHFGTTGYCQLGEGCSFAHGEHEIGQPCVAPEVGAANFSPQAAGLLKVKICQFWTQGNCPHGINCTFAHGDEELGSPQPVKGEKRQLTEDERLLQQMMGEMGDNNGGGGGGGGRGFMKSKLCNHFMKGSCAKENCNFAHGEHELGTEQAQMSGRGGTRQGQGFGSGKFTKSKLCVHFAAGFCTRPVCNFAHGEHELGEQMSPEGVAKISGAGSDQTGPIRKNKMCNHFMNTGSCPRGTGCGFAHGESEIGTYKLDPHQQQQQMGMEQMGRQMGMMAMQGQDGNQMQLGY